MLHHGVVVSSETNDTVRISCIDYSDDLLAVGNTRGAIHFYKLVAKYTRLRSESVLQVAPPAYDTSLNVPLTCIRFSHCSKYLSVGTVLGVVLVFDFGDSARLNIKYKHDDHSGRAISALCWSLDSTKLFSGCIGGSVIEFMINNKDDNPSDQWSASQLAIQFANKFIMQSSSSTTTVICQCEEIIRHLDCSFSENSSCGPADLLLVSVAHHTLLFQLPKAKNSIPRFCDIDRDQVASNSGIPSTSNRFKSRTEQKRKSDETKNKSFQPNTNVDEHWCSGCFSNSYVSYSKTRATGIFLVQNTRKTDDNNLVLGDELKSIAKTEEILIESQAIFEVLYCSINGEVQSKFPLKGPFRQRVASYDVIEKENQGEVNDGSSEKIGTEISHSCMVQVSNKQVGIRSVRSFSDTSHKHLLLAITSDNSLLLVNLQQMSCDFLLPQFDFSVHGVVPFAPQKSINYPQNIERFNNQRNNDRNSYSVGAMNELELMASSSRYPVNEEHLTTVNGKLLVFYEDAEADFMAVDVLETLCPSCVIPPIRIFDSHLHLAFSAMKTTWKISRLNEEIEGDDEIVQNDNEVKWGIRDGECGSVVDINRGGGIRENVRDDIKESLIPLHSVMAIASSGIRQLTGRSDIDEGDRNSQGMGRMNSSHGNDRQSQVETGTVAMEAASDSGSPISTAIFSHCLPYDHKGSPDGSERSWWENNPGMNSSVQRDDNDRYRRNTNSKEMITETSISISGVNPLIVSKALDKKVDRTERVEDGDGGRTMMDLMNPQCLEKPPILSFSLNLFVYFLPKYCML